MSSSAVYRRRPTAHIALLDKARKRIHPDTSVPSQFGVVRMGSVVTAGNASRRQTVKENAVMASSPFLQKPPEVGKGPLPAVFERLQPPLSLGGPAPVVDRARRFVKRRLPRPPIPVPSANVRAQAEPAPPVLENRSKSNNPNKQPPSPSYAGPSITVRVLPVFDPCPPLPPKSAHINIAPQTE